MPQRLKRPSWLRIGVVLLTLIWYPSFAFEPLGWLMLVGFIPLGALLLVAHWAAIKDRDWFSLTLLGAFWGSWMYWGDRWWPGNSYDETTAIDELWRQVRHDARSWIPSLVLAAGLYVWRASQGSWQATSHWLRLLAHVAALIGLAGFPLLLPSARGMIAEHWKGGAAMAVLYPTAVLSFTLFWAAFRSPNAVTAVSLRTALVVVALVVVAAVIARSSGFIVPGRYTQTFWSSRIWTLFGTDQLGIHFAGLALVWMLLAVLARRGEDVRQSGHPASLEVERGLDARG